MHRTDISWQQLALRLERLQSIGRPIIESNGQGIRAGSSSRLAVEVRHYPSEAIDDLIQWLRDAESLLHEENRPGMVNRLDRILWEFTEKPLACVADLSLSDFGPAEEGVNGWTFDAILAMEAFDLLVATLLEEARALVRLPQQETRRHGVDEPDFWTVDDLARFRGVSRKSIQKEVCYFRRDNAGRDPDWVRRLPGRQRGFKVHRATYIALMKRGMARSGQRSMQGH